MKDNEKTFKRMVSVFVECLREIEQSGCVISGLVLTAISPSGDAWNVVGKNDNLGPHIKKACPVCQQCGFHSENCWLHEKIMGEVARMDRKDVLLRAAYDLLRRSTEDFYVKEATSILVQYDDADCDGYCLMEDIANEIGIENNTPPIPLAGG